MSVQIAINSTREETRVAVIENRVVTELYIDRHRNRGIVGNVYKGRVVKVLPGMQAAFVDIGQERAAFLYVADASTSVDDYGQLMDEEDGEGDHIDFSGEPQSSRRASHLPIEEILQEGQDIMVQVTKEPTAPPARSEPRESRALNTASIPSPMRSK